MKESNDIYPWLDKDGERRNLTKRQIFEKYVDSKKSCLKDIKKKELMDLLCRQKDVCSLRGKIGTYPDIDIS